MIQHSHEWIELINSCRGMLLKYDCHLINCATELLSPRVPLPLSLLLCVKSLSLSLSFPINSNFIT